jgi:hypothetical protein
LPTPRQPHHPDLVILVFHKILAVIRVTPCTRPSTKETTVQVGATGIQKLRMNKRDFKILHVQVAVQKSCNIQIKTPIKQALEK